MFLEEYLTMWHLKALIIYVLSSSILPWYVIWRNKRLKPDAERDIERFKPFVRHDYNQWSYVACIFTHLLFWPRYLLCIGILIYAFFSTALIILGADVEKLGPIRK